jgi:hypothetical protein
LVPAADASTPAAAFTVLLAGSIAGSGFPVSGEVGGGERTSLLPDCGLAPAANAWTPATAFTVPAAGSIAGRGIPL